MLDDVLAHAESLGLKVKFTDLGRRAGETWKSGLVRINERKSLVAQRVAIAHECGHWVHEHDWSAAHDVPRDEREADLYAARLLISPVESRWPSGCTTGMPGPSRASSRCRCR